MKVIIFGATGMVGQGVLRECLKSPEVEKILTIGRLATGTQDAKIREIERQDLWHYEGLEKDLTGYDACFFCLGVSSAGMSEVDYRHITYDLATAAARKLATLNPSMVFIYVSGQNTDATEKGSTMWARIKGETENEIARLPFKATYAFRPGIIEPLDGIKSKTRLYRMTYVVMKPLMPLLRAVAPKHMLNTREMGQAMIAAAKEGSGRNVCEVADIRRLANAVNG